MVATIVPLDDVLAERISHFDGGNGWHGSRDKWRQVAAEVEGGARVTLIATIAGEPVGYGSLLWHSQNPEFVERGIPEVHDLVVAAHHRGGGNRAVTARSIGRRCTTEEALCRGARSRSLC